jgi:uncharacterized membrane protein
VSRPIVFELTTELDAPPDGVWRWLTDWERQGEWMREASDFVVCTDHREGIGVEAEATIRIGGIRTRDRIRVDRWEPDRHLGIEHVGWVRGRGDLSLQPLAGGRTRVDWREELRPPWGALGAIGLRVFRPLIARTFRRDLGFLADLVRADPTHRYSGGRE